MSTSDWLALDGAVPDRARIDLLRRYLGDLGRACADGVDARAYFHWSLLDNFEWQEGYKQRFGLVYMDFETQRRVVKQSGHWLRSLLAGEPAAAVEQLGVFQ